MNPLKIVNILIGSGWFFVSVFVTTVGIVYLARTILTLLSNNSRYWSFEKTLLSIVLSIVAIATGVFQVLHCSIPAQSILVSPTGTIVEKWERKSYRGIKIVDYLETFGTFESYAPREAYTNANVHLIEGQAIRNFRINVEAVAAGTAEAYLKVRRAAPDGNIGKVVKFYLYEFAEHNGKMLADFYNPLDDAKQQAFEGLVRETIGPHLEEKGIKIRRAAFALE